MRVAFVVAAWTSLCLAMFIGIHELMSRYHERVPNVSPDANARAFTLRVEDKLGHGGAGVGWAPGTVLTAAHIISGKLDTYTVSQGDKVWSVWHARYIADRDAVLLYVLGDEYLPVPPRRNTPIMYGEPVLVAGHPWDGPMLVTHGVVVGTPKGRPWSRLTDASVNPGNSGGPVFDGDGKLIAIITAATVGRGSTLSLALPITEVLHGLEQPDPRREGSLVGRRGSRRDGLYRPRYPAVPK